MNETSSNEGPVTQVPAEETTNGDSDRLKQSETIEKEKTKSNENEPRTTSESRSPVVIIFSTTPKHNQISETANGCEDICLPECREELKSAEANLPADISKQKVSDDDSKPDLEQVNFNLESENLNYVDTIPVDLKQINPQPVETKQVDATPTDLKQVGPESEATKLVDPESEETKQFNPETVEIKQVELTKPVEGPEPVETIKVDPEPIKTHQVDPIHEKSVAVLNGSSSPESGEDKENEANLDAVVASNSLLESQAEMAKCSVDELLRRRDEIDPGHKLRSLCKKGDAAALEEFIKSDVDLDVVSDEGWTSLHEIITHECQFTEIARILMSHGANVNTQDLHGDSPLHSCLLYHCTENIKLLLSHGADLDLTNGSGRKPIHVANDEESLRLLLEHGADVNAADQMGNTCLHYAVVAKDKDRVKLLLSSKYKSDVSIKNTSGSTPLHLTTDPEIAAVLLEAAADPNEVDLAGNSPLHLAVRGRHKEVVKNLMEKKANPNLTNLAGKLPVSLAKDKEMKNILAGKSASPSVTNGACGTGNVTPTLIQSRKRPYSPSLPTIETPTSFPMPKESPSSILKKVRRISNENGERTSRLRFSDVNEYNSIDQESESLNRRVKVRPIYSEPTFSSDED